MGRVLDLSGTQLGPDEVIATLAARQYGRMATSQLLAAGVTHRMIAARVRQGRLTSSHRGVYALAGTPGGFRAAVMAAVLACGPDAAAGRRTASRLLAMPIGRGNGIHVVVPGRSGRRRPGITIHRPRELDPTRDLTTVDGIPVTTPQRTALDLQHELTPREVEKVLDHFEFHLLDATPLLAARRFADALRDHVPGTTMTVSELEEIGLREARARRLDRPACNVWVQGATGRTYRGDLVFHAARLIAEVDGPHHRRPRQRRQDSARDADLRAAGWRIERVEP